MDKKSETQKWSDGIKNTGARHPAEETLSLMERVDTQQKEIESLRSEHRAQGVMYRALMEEIETLREALEKCQECFEDENNEVRHLRQTNNDIKELAEDWRTQRDEWKRRAEILWSCVGHPGHIPTEAANWFEEK